MSLVITSAASTEEDTIMASGITAKLLHVDLTTRQTRVEEIPEAVTRKYLGGGALACHILLRDMPAGVGRAWLVRSCTRETVVFAR